MALKLLGSCCKHFFEFGDGFVAEIHIFLRRRAGNILRGVGGGQIEASNEQARVEILGLLEVLNGHVVLAVLEGCTPLFKRSRARNLAQPERPRITIHKAARAAAGRRDRVGRTT